MTPRQRLNQNPSPRQKLIADRAILKRLEQFEHIQERMSRYHATMLAEERSPMTPHQNRNQTRALRISAIAARAAVNHALDNLDRRTKATSNVSLRGHLLVIARELNAMFVLLAEPTPSTKDKENPS